MPPAASRCPCLPLAACQSLPATLYRSHPHIDIQDSAPPLGLRIHNRLSLTRPLTRRRAITMGLHDLPAELISGICRSLGLSWGMPGHRAVYHHKDMQALRLTCKVREQPSKSIASFYDQLIANRSFTARRCSTPPSAIANVSKTVASHSISVQCSRCCTSRKFRNSATKSAISPSYATRPIAST